MFQFQPNLDNLNKRAGKVKPTKNRDFYLTENVVKESFNALEMQIFVNLPLMGIYIPFNEKLALLSYSTNRPRYPVTSLGYNQVKGFTQGTGLVAGSMVFTFKGVSPWQPVIEAYLKFLEAPLTLAQNIQVDELPPMDMCLNIIGDQGSIITKYITGFVLVDSSTVFDINQVGAHETFSFMAQDISNWEKVKV